jgi:two-component system chemotaxis response regulator CheY
MPDKGNAVRRSMHAMTTACNAAPPPTKDTMKTLIADDSVTSRRLLQELLKSYGPSDLAATGTEAVAAVRAALEAGAPYDLICLDIMMPEMDGQAALQEIRRLEAASSIAGPGRVKIIMTTALADKANILQARAQRCDCFLVKPIQKAKLLAELRTLRLID